MGGTARFATARTARARPWRAPSQSRATSEGWRCAQDAVTRRHTPANSSTLSSIWRFLRLRSPRLRRAGSAGARDTGSEPFKQLSSIEQRATQACPGARARWEPTTGASSCTRVVRARSTLHQPRRRREQRRSAFLPAQRCIRPVQQCATGCADKPSCVYRHTGGEGQTHSVGDEVHPS